MLTFDTPSSLILSLSKDEAWHHLATTSWFDKLTMRSTACFTSTAGTTP
jgi:hypothetical protein